MTRAKQPPTAPRRWAWGVGIVIAVVSVVSVAVWRLKADPGVVLLTAADDGAEWVRVDRPFDLLATQAATSAAEFDTAFTVPPGPGG